MIYFRCPTCKTLLANKQLVYEERMKNISKNSKLSYEEKDKAGRALLDELQLIRPCCRMRFIRHVPLIDVIK